jgi:hypothetical protein
MEKCFKSLADASVIIGDITEKASIQMKDYVSKEGQTVVEKISDYLAEYFKPLFGCDALKGRSLGGYDGVGICNKLVFNTLMNKNCNAFVLGLNIPLFGSRTYLQLVFFEGQDVVVYGDINEKTIKKLVSAWSYVKESLNKSCEIEISRYNRNCKAKVDNLVKLQNQINNFEV